ncbi:hypothetical protein DPMN_122662 [Dreissena polymorpha]|uniref:Uncharacterized protein n=1 Tax=Dreissena polymorpha TaxID=45954 RepID=A0A9D4GQ36_DREPO|nr:hypothetical protein DPMN_122662 [Dreissena polymorpha]
MIAITATTINRVRFNESDHGRASMVVPANNRRATITGFIGERRSSIDRTLFDKLSTPHTTTAGRLTLCRHPKTCAKCTRIRASFIMAWSRRLLARASGLPSSWGIARLGLRDPPVGWRSNINNCSKRQMKQLLLVYIVLEIHVSMLFSFRGMRYENGETRIV